MQIPLRTLSSVETYIANREWRNACLPRGPLHLSDGCSFVRHGSYARLNPPGIRVARWYCPEGRRTFSLLPDFMAVKLPGLLESIEDTVATTFSAKSMEAAAEAMRGFDVTLPSALRWLHRRVRAVKAVVDVVSQLVLERPNSIVMCAVAQIDFGQHVLLGLRRSLSLHRVEDLVERLHDRAPMAGVRRTGGADANRGNLEGGGVRVPKALESDVVAISAMHAGDAGIFPEAPAMVRGQIARKGLCLAGPGDDAAGVIASDIRLGQSARRRKAGQADDR